MILYISLLKHAHYKTNVHQFSFDSLTKFRVEIHLEDSNTLTVSPNTNDQSTAPQWNRIDHMSNRGPRYEVNKLKQLERRLCLFQQATEPLSNPPIVHSASSIQSRAKV